MVTYNVKKTFQKIEVTPNYLISKHMLTTNRNIMDRSNEGHTTGRNAQNMAEQEWYGT